MAKGTRSEKLHWFIAARESVQYDGSAPLEKTVRRVYLRPETRNAPSPWPCPDAQVEIKDLAGDGNHYAATVISAAFKGKSRVQQHQMVYAALKGNMGGVLHALALTTSTPQD